MAGSGVAGAVAVALVKDWRRRVTAVAAVIIAVILEVTRIHAICNVSLVTRAGFVIGAVVAGAGSQTAFVWNFVKSAATSIATLTLVSIAPVPALAWSGPTAIPLGLSNAPGRIAASAAS